MRKQRHSGRNNVALVEPMESRLLLSCAVASPASHATFSPPSWIQTVQVLQPITVNGIAVPAGTYSLLAFENLLTGTTSSAAQTSVTISSDSSRIAPGLAAPQITATVADASGNPLSDGTVTFYSARPVYDVADNDKLPCQDEAAKNKTALGSAAVVDGKAKFSLAALPVGEDWVWAEYSSDAVTKPIVSTYLPFTSVVATGMHIKIAGTYTATNALQTALTLTGANSDPLYGNSFAAPGAIEGAILTAKGKFDFHSPKPALPSLQTASYQGVLTSKTNVNGPTLYRAADSSQYSTVPPIIVNSGPITYTGNAATIFTATIFSVNDSTIVRQFPVFGGVMGGSKTSWPGYYGAGADCVVSSGGSLGLSNFSGVTLRQNTTLQLSGGSTTLSWFTTRTWTHTQYQAPKPTGSVVVSEGDRKLCTTSVTDVGTALARISGLAAGHHQLTFSYAGNGFFAPATKAVAFDIAPTPVEVKLKLSNSKVVAGAYYTATIDVSTLSKSLGSLSGNIQITCDGKLFSSMPVTGATKTLSADFPIGKHTIRATFVGTDGFGSATSAPAQIQVIANQKPQGNFWVGDKGIIRGLVLDGNQPDAALTCDILIDGKAWTRVVANQKTNAATTKNIRVQGDNGKHDFSVALPQLSAGKHLIQVVAYDEDLGTAFQLGANNSFTIEVVSPATAALSKRT